MARFVWSAQERLERDDRAWGWGIGASSGIGFSDGYGCGCGRGERGAEVRREVDWHLPCSTGCMIGEPHKALPATICAHAQAWSRLNEHEAMKVLGQVLRSRSDMAESLRRWQRGHEIESDYIDPFGRKS